MGAMRRAARAAAPPESVRFLLRSPADVHAAVVRAAEASGLSVNEYCVRRLRLPESPLARSGVVHAVASRAMAAVPGRLVGVVLHGSFARGEARQSSDVDVLVVVEPSVPLTRTLYRAWDVAPLEWEGRAVDVHFVHLPADPTSPGSVWCEAAIEGQVVGDPDGRIADVLRQIRRGIAEGKLVRKHAHGQPYWTKVA